MEWQTVRLKSWNLKTVFLYFDPPNILWTNPSECTGLDPWIIAQCWSMPINIMNIAAFPIDADQYWSLPINSSQLLMFYIWHWSELIVLVGNDRHLEVFPINARILITIGHRSRESCNVATLSWEFQTTSGLYLCMTSQFFYWVIAEGNYQ